MTTITASNLSDQTKRQQVYDFFSFCGKILDLTLEPDGEKTQKALITFERPSAARTALLLQDAHLDGSTVHVSSNVPLDGATTPPTDHQKPDHSSISQEDKPRTAVVAEYLSHGYTLTDQALQKAIDMDHTHGISKRFYGFLNSALGTAAAADQKLGVTQRAAAVDEKYAIQEKAKNTATGFMQYFETALDTPTGKKVRAFYDDRRKDALDIHNEARRLADERKAAAGASGGHPSTTAETPTQTYTPATTGLGSTAPASEKTGTGS